MLLAGEYEQAVEAYHGVLAKAYWTHANLALCYAQLGRTEEARTEAKAYKDALPENWSVREETEDILKWIRNEVDQERYLEGLRRAGLLE